MQRVGIKTLRITDGASDLSYLWLDPGKNTQVHVFSAEIDNSFDTWFMQLQQYDIEISRMIFIKLL